jgi:hypothetical protein
MKNILYHSNNKVLLTRYANMKFDDLKSIRLQPKNITDLSMTNINRNI